MHDQVFLYDSSNIDEYQWPLTEEGEKGRDYLYPFIKEGASPFLKNVSTKTFLVACNEAFLPITVNEKEYENSYIASNYYGIKFFEENASKKFPFLKIPQKPLFFLVSGLLKLFKINKTIFLNNWLMTNSLAPKISSQEMGAICQFLTKRFPKHMLIFRHVDAFLKKDLFDSLKGNHFHLLRTRDVFFYEPAPEDKEKRSVRQRDLNILKKYDLEIVPHEAINESDYPRLLELYEKLYIKKYTRYSPHYTVDFLKNTHQKKMVHYSGVKRNGVLEGFLGHFCLNKGMIFSLFGYETEAPHAHDLYKILTRIGLEEAKKLNLILNDGSGGEAAKLNRGLKPSSEYMAIYHKHLPLPRRLLWSTIALFFKLFS